MTDLLRVFRCFTVIKFIRSRKAIVIGMTSRTPFFNRESLLLCKGSWRFLDWSCYIVQNGYFCRRKGMWSVDIKGPKGRTIGNFICMQRNLILLLILCYDDLLIELQNFLIWNFNYFLESKYLLRKNCPFYFRLA